MSIVKLAGFSSSRVHIINDDICLSILIPEDNEDRMTIFCISTNCSAEECTHTYTKFSNKFSAEQQLGRFLIKYSSENEDTGRPFLTF